MHFQKLTGTTEWEWTGGAAVGAGRPPDSIKIFPARGDISRSRDAVWLRNATAGTTAMPAAKQPCRKPDSHEAGGRAASSE